MNNVFTIGTDPEFMLKNKGKLVSAVAVIDGNKENPLVLNNGAHLIYDNVNVEFATAVAGSVRDFVKKIKDTFMEVNKVLPVGHTMHVQASAQFPEAELQTEDALEFGCDCDYNAWTLLRNDTPDISKNKNLRVCGGHIHVGQKKGYEFLNTEHGKILTVQAMDCFLGVISTILDCSLQARIRRELYGKAGCHRPTEYGVEYRVLSNFWLKSPLLVQLMYSLTDDALRLVDKELVPKVVFEIGKKRLLDTINKHHSFEAKKIADSVLLNYMSKKSTFYLRRCLKGESKIKNTSYETLWGLN